jgi:hypothetical protein
MPVTVSGRRRTVRGVSQRTRAFITIAFGVAVTPFFLWQFFSDPEASEGWEVLALFVASFCGIVGGVRMLRAADSEGPSAHGRPAPGGSSGAA